jgi:hypothetical protein
MKTNRKYAIALAMVVICAAVFNACKKDAPAPPTSTAQFNMRMTDSPGSYQEVNVEILGADVHSDVTGWTSLRINAGIYNLLTLCNGRDTLLASGLVGVGNVSQIRLTLGTNNSVKINNVVYPLATPSAQQSGLKLQIHTNLVQNVPYNVTLDFDAANSVVATGSGSYILKPVIRTIVAPFSSGVKGVVMPLAANPAAVFAIMAADTFSTYTNAITGAYVLQGLTAGAYKVIIMPKAPYTDTTLTSVSVNGTAMSNMGTITVH